MKLELIAQPGQAPEAVLLRHAGIKRLVLASRIAQRLLGPRGGRYDTELSYDWQCVVHCTPEFSAWWRGRAGTPIQRIFLEVTSP